ncbi:MAG: FAD-dependent oxidoreductase, partial [Actinomycetaceae bacterium]
MAPSAVVVGGGIAGLASALALAGTGWDVTVLERS